MRTVDRWRLAGEALSRHRLRTALTLLAVGIGAAAVLALAAVGDAAKRYVLDQFAGVGAQLLTVSPGRTETSGLGGMPGLAGTRPLTVEDADALRRRLPEARRLAALSLGTAEVEGGGRARHVFVVGTTGDFAPMRGLVAARGRLLPGEDAARRARVVVLGARLARELYGEADPVGEPVRISGQRFRVVGVLRAKGSSLGLDFDDMALVPVLAGMSLFGQRDLHHVIVQAASADAVSRVREQLRAALVDRHGEEDFTIVTQDALLDTVRDILDRLTLALAGIAALSLAVAGVGIMNVMLVAVSERTAEVGLLRALGATPGDVQGLFLAEAAALSVAGALAGAALELALLAVARRLWPAFPLALDATWMLGVTLFALVVGVVFAWAPARRAARLSPAAALGRRP